MKDKQIKKVSRHLAGDIKGYKKEIKYLKSEVNEDEELKRGLKKSHGKTKKACCSACEKDHNSKGRKSPKGSRVKAKQKAGGK